MLSRYFRSDNKIIRNHFYFRTISSSIPVSWGNIHKMVDKSCEPTTRILFCGPHFPASHNYTREYLQNHTFIQVDDVPLDDVPDSIGNYDICVVKSMHLNSDIISHAKRMKLIMQFGVGLEGVDVGAATHNGIKVARIPSGTTGNATSCAEMAIYLMLGLLRKQVRNAAGVLLDKKASLISTVLSNFSLSELQVSVSQKKLGEPIGGTLFGKTVFIMGFGNIGIHLAKRLRPFGVKIHATKRSWQNSCHDESYTENGNSDDIVDEKGTHADILKFASQADIVVCCLIMNKETAGIVNKDFLSSMRKGALLINISRGGLLDYDAVLHHLKSGHLGGLGIDVAWTEPFDPQDGVLQFPNVILTPHVAGVTEHSYRCMAKVVGDVALELHAGKPLSGLEFVN